MAKVMSSSSVLSGNELTLQGFKELGRRKTEKSDERFKAIEEIVKKVQSDKQHLLQNAIDKLVLDSIVDRCCLELQHRVHEFSNNSEIRDVVENVVLDYIHAHPITLSLLQINAIPYASAIEELAENIYFCQIAPLLSNSINEISIGEESKEKLLKLATIADREREYLNKKGVSIDHDLILQKAAELASNGKYEEFVLLSEKHDKSKKFEFKSLLLKAEQYALSASKCLISFEDESNFIERLKDDKVLVDHIAIYRDHINRTLLHYAVAKGKVAIVEEFCKIPVISELINQGDGYLRTPLHIASTQNYVGVIDLLVEFGADLSCKDGYGRTVLHLAASSGNIAAVKSLVNVHKVSIDVQDKYGRTPLHLAAMADDVDVINLLVEAGADLSCKDDYGRTALHLAATNDKSDAIRKLYEFGANMYAKDNNKNTPLTLAVLKDGLEAVKAFYKINIEMLQDPYDDKGNTPLHLAAQINSLKVLEFLLQLKNQNPNQCNIHGSTALHNAAYYGHYDTVRLLLKYADTTAKDTDDRTALLVTMKKIDMPSMEESIISNKLRCAAILINYDYSDFIRSSWRSDALFFSKESITKFDVQYNYKEVHDFILKSYKFLKEEEQLFIDTKDCHIPIPLKINKDSLQLTDLLAKCPPDLVQSMTKEEKKTLYDSNNKIGFHKILHKICPDIYTAKKLNCAFEDEELGQFLMNPQEFCDYYIQQHHQDGVNTNQDVFTLALYEAIYRNEPRLVKYVLDIVDENIQEMIMVMFTSVIENNLSPAYVVLSTDNKDVFKLLKNYIKNHSDSIIKVNGAKNDLASIESLLESIYYCDNGKSKIEHYYDDFLSYLYENNEISEYKDALIAGEELPRHAAIFADFI